MHRAGRCGSVKMSLLPLCGEQEDVVASTPILSILFRFRLNVTYVLCATCVCVCVFFGGVGGVRACIAHASLFVFLLFSP